MRVCLIVLACWRLLAVAGEGNSQGGLDVLIPNGVSDVWELAYDLRNPRYDRDADGDGRSDREEAEDGTDPRDPTCVFRLQLERVGGAVSVMSWKGLKDRSYQVESYRGGKGWGDAAPLLGGYGGAMSQVLPGEGPAKGLFRLRIEGGPDLPIEGIEALEARDSDQDGLDDYLEWLTGSSPADAAERFAVSVRTLASHVVLAWWGEDGVSYELEALEGGMWSPVAGPFAGAGVPIRHVQAMDSPSTLYRLRRSMVDVDEDGLMDWEEVLIGSDPQDPRSKDIEMTDMLWAQSHLGKSGEFHLEGVLPVVAEEGASARIRIRREGGCAPVELAFDVPEGWNPAHPSPIGLRAGEMERELEFSPSPGAESGELVLVGAAGAQSGAEARTWLIRVGERLLNVRDYGAVGDGVADDTSALIRACEALEDDPQADGLFFPSGRYRMAKVKPDGDSPFGSRRLLELGNRVGLDGRDLLLKGEEGSELFSEVSPARVNMLIVRAGFRSLVIDSLIFEQDSVPLKAVPGYEPNGSDALTFSADGFRKVEGVFITNCDFINCHRAVSVYGNGYDIRGNGGVFSMWNCQVINPYGANTQDSATAWGGGQQIYLAAWVKEARYVDCVFVGGSGEGLDDPIVSPGGRVKDGCHFGSPLRLVFQRNVVRAMGVEAAHQTNEATFMGSTTGSFLMPAADGLSFATVTVSNTPSSWNVGEAVNIRSPGVPGSSPANNRMIIRGLDPATRTLSLSNPGLPGNVMEGFEIPANRRVYLDERDEATLAEFSDNFFDGSVPDGGAAFFGQAAIVSQARSRIRGNVVLDHGVAVLTREDVHTPAFPAERAARITGNFIVTRDARDFPETYTYGTRLEGGEEWICDNIVLCPISWKTVGVAALGRDTSVRGNTLRCLESVWNGYASPERSVGIGNGNYGLGMAAWDNRTRGFDVGVGPIAAFLWPAFRVRGHESVHDALAIDSFGRQPW